MNKYYFTGNPFVDTGLSVLVARAHDMGWTGETVQELTPDALRYAIGDAKWLARANRRLNAFDTTCLNNPLINRNLKTNPSYYDSKLNPEYDKGFQEYVTIIRGLLEEAAIPTDSSKDRCECCGAQAATKVLAVNGKDVGRAWFPLAGSLGSDAQALPASSRAPMICALCLLAIQVLPLGVTLLNGRLACFQSTSWEMTQQLTEDVYRETCAKLAASNDKLPALGAKGKTTETAERLLHLFSELRAHRREFKLPNHVTMNVWLFSNAKSADCDLIEIPNNALVFMWEAQLYRAEVDELLHHEPKKLDYQLLECIRRQHDYDMLYPMKGKPAVSKELFALYQTKVMERLPQSLQVAEKIAYLLRYRLQEQAEGERREMRGRRIATKTPGDKLLKQLKERHPSDRKYGVANRKIMQCLFADFAEEGWMSINEYVLLFPAMTLHPLRTCWEGWKWIWFYLNHEDLSIDVQSPQWDEVAMFTNPKIKAFAQDVFDDYVHRRGLARVKRDILDSFRRNAITTTHLQRWFCNLAETKEGYTNEDWDNLCRDENGNNLTAEVRFQFRLELANLYRQAIAEQ